VLSASVRKWNAHVTKIGKAARDKNPVSMLIPPGPIVVVVLMTRSAVPMAITLPIYVVANPLNITAIRITLFLNKPLEVVVECETLIDFHEIDDA